MSVAVTNHRAARAVRLIAVATAVGLVIAVVWALRQPADAVVGFNHVQPAAFVVTLQPGQEACGALGRTTRPADDLVMTIGTYRLFAQAVRLTVDGHQAAPFSRYREGVVALPLPVGAQRGGIRACLANEGTSKIALAGVPTGDEQVTIDGRGRKAALSFQLTRRDPGSWGDRASAIWHHVASARDAPLGLLTPWLILAAFVAAVGVGFRAVLKASE